MWAGVNDILMRKRKAKSLINLIINNKLENNEKNIANEFNTFYSNVGPELSKKITSNNKHNFKDFLQNPSPNSLFFSPTTPDEISKFIKSLDINKSSDIYGISVKIVKTVTFCQKPVVVSYIQLFIRTGYISK